jgi:hypothetical protein
MDDLDRIFSADESIVPSSGFARSVMDAVGSAAEEPPPLPFPWIRFAAGLLACLVWAGSAIWLVNLTGGDVLVTSIAAKSEALAYAAGTALGCLAFLSVLRIRRVDAFR